MKPMKDWSGSMWIAVVFVPLAIIAAVMLAHDAFTAGKEHGYEGARPYLGR